MPTCSAERSHSHWKNRDIFWTLGSRSLSVTTMLNFLGKANTSIHGLGEDDTAKSELHSQKCVLWFLFYYTFEAVVLVDLVDQLTLESVHCFWFYGSCQKRIPIRHSLMPKRILSQCGVSSEVFIYNINSIGLTVQYHGDAIRITIHDNDTISITICVKLFLMFHMVIYSCILINW